MQLMWKAKYSVRDQTKRETSKNKRNLKKTTIL